MKWVKALRSGKYKQGKETLVKVKGFYDLSDEEAKVTHCCLGVLGEICGIDRILLSRYDSLQDGMDEHCGLSSDTAIPSNNGACMIKFKHKGKVRYFDDLAGANDSGVSFKRIATWIEKNYKLL